MRIRIWRHAHRVCGWALPGESTSAARPYLPVFSMESEGNFPTFSAFWGGKVPPSLTARFDFGGRSFCIRLRRLDTNDSSKSAPFSANAFLKDGTVLCSSASSIMNSAST